MINLLGRKIAAGAIVFGLSSSIAIADSGQGSVGRVPPMPTNIEVPVGFSLFFKAHAVGTQNYICLPSATSTTGVAWTFIAPEATLFDTFFGFIEQQVSTHFLSPNPDEAELPRATWQHSLDSSRVWARMDEQSKDANFVAPGAIPWFRLIKVGTDRGPEGGGFLAQTEYIQRLNTAGGIAPLTGCAQSSNIGALTLAPYEADYFFYRKSRAK